MSQKLCLPINKMKMTASYKNAQYLKQFGFTHYGIDAVSTNGVTDLIALGDGTVIACGQDGSTQTGSTSKLGNCIVIVYKDVQRNDGKVSDLSCRIFHMASIAVKVGDTVKAGTVIGKYGNTGANTTGAHLHIEFDTDIQYPRHAVGIAASGNVIIRGTVDSTVNPSKVWFRKKDQTIVGYGSGWNTESDLAIPTLETVTICPTCGSKLN